MASVRVDMKVDTDQAKALMDGGKTLPGVLKAGLYRAGAVLQKEIKDRTPVDTGGLKASERLHVTVNAVKAEASVTSNKLYGPAVELGTKGPRKPPPASALMPWARRNLQASVALTVPKGQKGAKASRQKALMAAVRAIQRHIAMHGTRGRFMFSRGTQAAEQRVQAILQVTGTILAKKLGGS